MCHKSLNWQEVQRVKSSSQTQSCILSISDVYGMPYQLWFPFIKVHSNSPSGFWWVIKQSLLGYTQVWHKATLNSSFPHANTFPKVKMLISSSLVCFSSNICNYYKVQLMEVLLVLKYVINPTGGQKGKMKGSLNWQLFILKRKQMSVQIYCQFIPQFLKQFPQTHKCHPGGKVWPFFKSSGFIFWTSSNCAQTPTSKDQYYPLFYSGGWRKLENI